MKINRHIVLGTLIAIPAVMQANLKAEETIKKDPIITLHTHKVYFNEKAFKKTDQEVPTYETTECTNSRFGNICYNVTKPVEMHSYYQYGEVVKPHYTNVSQILNTKPEPEGQGIKPIIIKTTRKRAKSYYNDDGIRPQYYNGNDNLQPNYTNVSQINLKK